MIDTVAVVGAGLIGRAWAIVFARAGIDVMLYDTDPDIVDRALAVMAGDLQELADHDLVGDPGEIFARIRPVRDLASALEGVGYVQESGPEDPGIKSVLFKHLDALAPPDAILASSSSGIPASVFTVGLPGRHRCLVAHPVNPPSLIPLVELVPAPWTTSAVVETCRTLMIGCGQEPITLTREIEGFVLNRLQGALLNEALRLAEDGYASVEDIDKAVSQGLGLRWAFMGPFETIDLNAPGGLADYARRYGPLYERMARSQADPRPWSPTLIDRLDAARRRILGRDALARRQAWRDRRLMALRTHLRRDADASTDDG